jgi:hypothetical protein
MKNNIKKIDEKKNIINDNKKIIELKQLEEGVYHDGEKVLYDTPPDREWNCLCMKGDKELCVFLFKCGIMSSVLGFCMIMLMNNNKDGFYISTLSLILGGVMGSENSKTNNNNNKIDKNK